MNLKERIALCEEFLSELGSGIPDHERVMVGYAAEATVQTDATGRKLNAGWWPEPWNPDRARYADNCYVCISSSIKTPNPKTGHMRYWRGEASFGHGLALMVDDIGSGLGSKGGLTVEGMSLQLLPTAVVRTSPGNHQLWYFFDEPVASMPLFKAFLVSFVKYVLTDKGGDSTIRDVSRYGRMPIGINNKRVSADGPFKYGGKNGCPVDIVVFDPMNRYSMDQIAEAFKFTIDPPPTPREPEHGAEYDAVWLDIAVRVLSKSKLGESSGGDVNMNMSGKYRIQCPWGDSHTNGDPYGAYFRGPIPGADHAYVFGCAHDTCRKEHKRTWASFVDEIVMPIVVERLRQANERAANE